MTIDLYQLYTLQKSDYLNFHPSGFDQRRDFPMTILTLCQWEQKLGGKIISLHFYRKTNIGLDELVG